MAGLNFTTGSVPVADKVFNGGLNSTAGPFGLKENESSDLQNVDFDKFGSLLKRNGYATLNTGSVAASPCDGLYWYEYDASGTTTRKAIYVCAGKIYRMDDLDGQWDDASGAVTITSSNMCDFETFLGKLFVTNNVDVPFELAGTGTAGVSAVPTGLTKAKFVKQFNNYLFYANVTVSSVVYKSRIYWSNIRDTATWGAANWIEVSKDDGQEITGLKVLSDRLVIYKQRSIYNLFFTGDADIPFILPGGGKSNSAVGCIAPFSIQEVENGHVFLAIDGVYYYDGLNSYKISNNITNTIMAYNTSRFEKAASLVHKSKNRYWLSFTTAAGTQHNRVMVWDYYNNAWSLYAGGSSSNQALSCCAMCTFYVNGVTESPYFSDYAGYVYKGDYGTDDYPRNVSTAIDAYYYTNWRSYDDLCDQKGVPSVYIYYQIQNAVLTFAYSYDFESVDQYTQTMDTGGGTSVYDSSLYGVATYANQGGNCQRRDLTGRGRVVRFKFANGVSGETFRIDGFGALPHLETYK
jgi:hypothetical protein